LVASLGRLIPQATQEAFS